MRGAARIGDVTVTATTTPSPASTTDRRRHHGVPDSRAASSRTRRTSWRKKTSGITSGTQAQRLQHEELPGVQHAADERDDHRDDRHQLERDEELLRRAAIGAAEPHDVHHQHRHERAGPHGDLRAGELRPPEERVEVVRQGDDHEEPVERRRRADRGQRRRSRPARRGAGRAAPTGARGCASTGSPAARPRRRTRPSRRGPGAPRPPARASRPPVPPARASPRAALPPRAGRPRSWPRRCRTSSRRR